MTSEQVQAVLRADLQAFDDGATTPDKLVALRAWMVDVSLIVFQAYQYSEAHSGDTEAARLAFRKLQRQLLMHQRMWNPGLLHELTD